jgi:hypothetical protein
MFFNARHKDHQIALNYNNHAQNILSTLTAFLCYFLWASKEGHMMDLSLEKSNLLPLAACLRDWFHNSSSSLRWS